MPEPLPLKLKHRNRNKSLQHRTFDPPGGTWVYKAGSHSSKHNNSGKAQKAKQGTGARRRQGLGSVGL